MKTILFSLMIMLGVFGMIWSAVVLVQKREFFSSAPEDIQAAISDREERFFGARALGYGVMALSVMLCILAFVLAIRDGSKQGFGCVAFAIRFWVMLYLYLLFDVVFLDWFLLTKSGFYQHFYPETRGCRGYHSFGYNRKEKRNLMILFPILAWTLGVICAEWGKAEALIFGCEALFLMLVRTLFVYGNVRKNRLHGIFRYSRAVQQRAVKLKLIKRQDIERQKKNSIQLMVLTVAAIVLIAVFGINGVRSWSTAFIQIYGLLFYLNLFDALVVDWLWFRNTDFWRIPEITDMKIWKSSDLIIAQRAVAALGFVPISALMACLACVL